MALKRSAGVVAALLLLGRATGFGREWMLSARGGASGSTDLAIVLFTLPDLLVNLLLAGGLGATLVPVLQGLPISNRRQLAGQVALLVGAGFALLALLLILLAPQLLDWLAPGVSGAQRMAAAKPLALTALAVPLTAMAGVSTALLNASGRFALGACGTTVFNLSVIAALATRLPLLWAMAGGVVAGALLRWLVQSLGVGTAIPVVPWRGPWQVDRHLLLRFGGNFGFASAVVLLPPIARSWASLSDPGALSMFNYAAKLVELPLGVLMGSLSAVLLPHLASNPAPSQIRRTVRLAAISALVIAVPALLTATPLARLVYFKADFSPLQLQELGRTTAWAFAFLLPQALVSLYGTVFAALGRTRPLVLTGVMMLFVELLLAPLGHHLGGLIGVMVANGCVYVLAACLLSLLLQRELAGLMVARPD
jgi:putative peptidoglycan lipid II flippase